MSTIDVDNIQDSNGVSLATTYVTGGSAKVYCSWNNTSILFSLNVASVTDNGTGDYTTNLTNAMAASDYPAVTSLRAATGRDNTMVSFHSGASTIEVEAFDVSVGGNIDAGFYQSLFGDLA